MQNQRHNTDLNISEYIQTLASYRGFRTVSVIPVAEVQAQY